MVKLLGPALGQEASGSLAKSVIFSKSRGRPYLKLHQKPKQPRSLAQQSMRAIMSFLSQQWSTLGPTPVNSWNTLALASNISPFNAYQRENLNRFKDGLAPSTTYPAAETGLHAVLSLAQAIGGVRTVLHRFNCTDPRNNWGLPVYQITGTGAPYTWRQTVHILPVRSIGWHEWRQTGLSPGTYWFRFSDFTLQGLAYLGHGSEMSATVT